MASVSGATSSLSGTLRGYGGMATGIDRDSIIEQMSLASTTKIQNQKNAITSLTWKQEAFQGIINQILDLQENYLSYSAKSNVMDASMFAKSVITANGDEKISKYVKASGSSELLESMSIRGVEKLATAANVQSGKKTTDAIATDMSYDKQPQTSNLSGTKLVFGHYGTEGRFFENATFTMPTSYKDEKGETQTIDYTGDPEKLAEDLNAAIKADKFFVSKDLNLTIQFEYDKAADQMTVHYAKATLTGDKYEIDTAASETELKAAAERAGIVISGNSSALGALGFDKEAAKAGGADGAKGYSLADYNKYSAENKAVSGSGFTANYVKTYDNMAEYLKGKKFTVSYGGQSKEVELITAADAEALKAMESDPTKDMNAEFAAKMQAHLDKAFGKDKIKVGQTAADADGKTKITFDNAKDDDENLITFTSKDGDVMKQTGFDVMNSNKVSTNSSLWANRERLGFDKDITEDEFKKALENFEINGVKIGGLTSKTTVNQLLSKINSSGAGVKASYLGTSNKFTLVSTETGSGRKIELTGTAANAIFGDGGADSNKDGEDAVMYVDYGTGPEKVVSSTNTFDLDGLKVTVSGEFGIEKNDDGSIKTDASGVVFDKTQAITFNASADVEKATEAVKKFIEDYNALVKAVNTEITTKPDKDYGPLTDEQKDEMNETSIENWEKKAKSGLLFNDPIMRDLSMDLQGVLTQAMNNGISYDDLEEMGITMSDDAYDGGTLKFDETKFKAAMESDPEKVRNVFAGGGGVKKGLGSIVNDTTKQYATRYSYLNKGSYGRLVEEAGSERMTLSLQNNTIYRQLKDMQDTLADLKTKLKSEQDRYIQMFTRMETAISNMNSQSSYLSSLSG